MFSVAGLVMPLSKAQAKTLQENHYDLFFGIVQIGNAIIRTSVDESDFKITIQARPLGILKLVSDETWTLHTEGFRSSEGFEALTYQAKSLGSERKRNTRVSFSFGGTPTVRRTPPDKHAKDRTPIPQDILAIAIDPLTATLRTAYKLQTLKTCSGKELVFDGIHLFYVVLNNKGKEKLDKKSGYVSGTAYNCEFQIQPLGGYRHKYAKERKEGLENAKRNPPRIWYRSLSSEHLPDIVRIDIPSRYGHVTAYLRK